MVCRTLQNILVKGERFFKRKSSFLFIGTYFDITFVANLYKALVHFSTDKSCMMCHVPVNHTWAHDTAKTRLGIKDTWAYLIKGSADAQEIRKSIPTTIFGVDSLMPIRMLFLLTVMYVK